MTRTERLASGKCDLSPENLRPQEVIHSPHDPYKLFPKRITNVLCSDGIQRSATITGPPDTFFSIPARVKVGGKTVSGFVSSDETYQDATPNIYYFVAYGYAKNGHLLPNGFRYAYEK